MQRTVIFPVLLFLAACGGGTPRATGGGGGGGEPVGGGEVTPPASDPVDPRLARREGFANPGGMWMPRQMAEQAELLAELGLEIEATRLADLTAAPLSAVVSLGGCTGSFVSPEGLVITNHHCVQGALQLNSTPEQNLVETGFLAATRADEKPAGATQRIYVAQKVTDVSGDMLAGLGEVADPRERALAVEAREKALVAACEKDRPAVKCRISSFFAALEWQLIEYLEIRDVRLVYVPSRAVGNYGGEIDNWAWPRHTGDFSFMRAYVGKDGQPADPSPDNVPYQPAAYLELGTQGVASNDLVFVAGYPGRTSRLQTAAELRRATEWTYPRYIEKGNQRMALLEKLQAEPGETAIKAGVMRQSVQNGLEKFGGILDTLLASDLIDRKEADEQGLRAWAGEDAGRQRYLDALDKVGTKLAAMWTVENQEEAWKDAVYASNLLGQAIFFVRWAHEQEKPDAERKPGFQERDRSLVVAGQKTFAKRFDATIDRAMWKLMLTRAAADPAAASWLRPMLGLGKKAKVDEKAIDKALDGFYAKTKLADEQVRLALLDATPAKLKKSKDPFVKLAVALYPRIAKMIERDEADRGELLLLSPVHAEGVLAYAGGMVAPDANSTLRVSYGIVRGYRPNPDADPYVPFTTLTEIAAKNTGVEPFDAPKAVLDAAATAGAGGPYVSAELGTVPVDFLSDVDTTGGNSGSPILDARGRLVGLHFDRNKEGVSSEVYFKAATTRSIATDIRYVLWVADAIDQADHVLREMGVEPAL
jgi:hypothetical protein